MHTLITRRGNRMTRLGVGVYLVSGGLMKFWYLKAAQRSLGSTLDLVSDQALPATVALALLELSVGFWLWLGNGRAELWTAAGMFQVFTIFLLVEFHQGNFSCGCFPGLSDRAGIGPAVFLLDMTALFFLVRAAQSAPGGGMILPAVRPEQRCAAAKEEG